MQKAVVGMRLRVVICKVTEDHLCWESQVKLEETGVSGLFLQPLRTRFSKEGKNDKMLKSIRYLWIE